MRFRRGMLKTGIMAKWILNSTPNKTTLILVSVFCRGMSLASPILFGYLISSFSNGEANHRSLTLLGLIIAFELAVALSSWKQENMSAKVFFRQERNLKLLVWNSFQNIPRIKRDATAPSNWMQKIGRDVSMLSGVCRMLFDTGTIFIVSLVGTTIVVIYRAPILSLIFACALLMMLVIPKIFHKKIGLGTKKIRESYYKEAETVMSAIEMQSTATLFNVKRQFVKLFEKAVKNTEESMYSHQANLNRLNFVLQVELWGIRGIVLIVCTALLLKKQITIGDVVTYNMLVSQVLGSLSQLILIFPQITIGLEYAKSINETISQGRIRQKKDVKNKTLPGTNAVPENLAFDIRDISFKYPTATNPTIFDFSAKFYKGEYICFLGRNGSGKSTLIKLLVGDYEPNKGIIYKNCGVISLVPQNIVVYNDTMLENIRLMDDSISEEDVEFMVRKAGLERLIDDSLLGLHKAIMPGHLSGGELQILGIARALVRNPDVLIVDEITNNLDIVAKETVFSVLRRIQKTRTIISITHDHSSIDEADRVFVFRKDGIIEVKESDNITRSKLAISFIRKELAQ